MNNRREPEESDLKFWRTFTENLKPIKKPERIFLPKAPLLKQRPTTTELPQYNAPPPDGLVSDRVVENNKLFKTLLKNLKQNEYQTLDLHNYTLDEAFARLTIFIKQSYTNGHKILLIITGKGLGGENTIQTQLPRWLMYTKIRRYIKHYMPADRKHGGNGAFFVALRVKPH